MEAGLAMSTYPIAGFFGIILAGIISDRIFNADRNIPTLLYGLANISGFILSFWGTNSKLNDAMAS